MTLGPRASVGDLSYAGSGVSYGGRVLIRLLENATGRRAHIRRGSECAQGAFQDNAFFDVMAKRFGVSLNVQGGSLDHIPQSGPVIIVSNHPYGILDGLMMGLILSKARSDFKILANSVSNGSQALDEVVLPIRFDHTKAAMAQNLETRCRALGYLNQGGAVGVFPGGTVSMGAKMGAQPMDPRWRSFTARMIAKSDAVVVPVYVHGVNSQIFQLASHLHMNLRLGLLIRQFKARVDTPVTPSIGRPIGRDILDPLAKDATALMDFLRRTTYALCTDADPCFDLGYDFEMSARG